MRIVKSTATAILEDEKKALEAQVELCKQQESKISSISLMGMKGKGVEAVQRNIQRQSKVVKSHRLLFESLADIDGQNVAAIEALPETSQGVIDTEVAQDRIDRANAAVRELVSQQLTALANARRANSNARIAYNNNPARSPYSTFTPPCSISSINTQYGQLIGAQLSIVRVNQSIIDKASEYDRLSEALYQRVDLSIVSESTKSVNSYLATGSWGSSDWESRLAQNSFWGGVWTFITGDAKVSAAMAETPSDWGKAEGDFLGIGYTGAVSGKLFSGSASIKPYGKYKDECSYNKDSDEYEEHTALSVGVIAAAEASFLEGKAEGKYGWGHADAKAQVLTGAVSGTLGASLMKDGKLDPSLKAELAGSVSIAKGEANVRAGSNDYNVHGKAEGDLFTAKAQAGVSVGKDGVTAKAGAEAYAAQGKVSGGITILGVKIDVGLEGKAGGAGAKAAAEAKARYVKGELGIGLGLGAGVSFSVDWSGAPEAIGNAWNGIQNWWDGLPH